MLEPAITLGVVILMLINGWRTATTTITINSLALGARMLRPAMHGTKEPYGRERAPARAMFPANGLKWTQRMPLGAAYEQFIVTAGF